MPYDTDKTSEFWTACLEEREKPGRAGWMYAIDHPRLRTALYDTYLGGLDPFSWMRARMPTPARFALEIGCGRGDLAFGLIRDGFCERIDAFDIAEGAITAAQAGARERGMRTLRFHLLDGNRWVMAHNQYDFVYASHALHHIDNLEHLFAQVAETLQPGGTLFASDYIGPSRMQYADAQVAAMNAALAILPKAKRRDRFGGVKARIERRPVELYLQNDPSEAARSAEIVPIMRRFFDVEVVPMGMSLSFEVLLDIVHNFDPDSDRDNALIDRIVRMEGKAERSGAAEPLFACLLARHKPAPVAAPAARPPEAVPLPPLPPDLERFRGVEGAMADEAADLTVRLFGRQRSMGAVTGVLELGVGKGRYLSLLASLSQGTGAPIVGIDAFAPRPGEPVPDADRYGARDAAAAIIAALAPGASPPTLIAAAAAEVDIGTLRGLCPAGYSFISVNAGPSAEDVAAALAMAGQLAAEHTAVAVADVFNPQTPGVTEGLCRHFAANPGTALAPFAWAGDQLFLCHRAAHPATLSFVHGLLRDPAAPPYVARSRETSARNERFRPAPALFGHGIVAFDAA